MRTRRIGSLDVSVIGLGTNNLGLWMQADEVPAVVTAALDAGITFFDTSDSYGESEQRLGKTLRGRRDEVVLATKFGNKFGDREGGAAPAYVRQAVERSLRKLSTDRIDLYQLHRPDPATPIADTLAALDELVRAGKVREIGCSNFSAGQIEEAKQARADGAAQFVSVQNHYNLLHRGGQAEVLEVCTRLGVVHLPFFPLASGLLTGKYRRGEPAPTGTRLATWGARGEAMLNDETFDCIDRLAAWAELRSRSLLELAFAWLLADARVASVIAGATKPEQVVANVAAGASELTPTEVAEVDELVGARVHE